MKTKRLIIAALFIALVFAGNSVMAGPFGFEPPHSGNDLTGAEFSAPAVVTSFTGTISAATRTATFTETADYALAKVGSTLIAGGDTRIIVALLGSDQVTVDADTTWAGSTAITSLQEPQSQGKQSDGTVKNYVNADGGINLLGGTGFQNGLAFGDGDSGFYEHSDDLFRVRIGGDDGWEIGPTLLGSLNGAGAALLQEVATSVNPVLVPSRNDPNTGLGWATDDQLSLIAGAVEGQRIIEANSIIYNVLNAVQQDSITNATTNGTTTISKAGENFNTTCIAGDTVLIWGGTTTADYGVYSIATVTSDTALVLDRALSGTQTDMDFYVFRGGTITTGAELRVDSDVLVVKGGNVGIGEQPSTSDKKLTVNGKVVIKDTLYLPLTMSVNANANLTINLSTDAGEGLIINGNHLAVGTTDLDGTPATGRLVVKGTTNDGSTNILVGRDSDEANVFSVDTDGGVNTGTALIKTINEPVLGDRLTIGLDETARTMVICDKGDVDTDFGLSIASHPQLVIADDDATDFLRLTMVSNEARIQATSSASTLVLESNIGNIFRHSGDISSGDANTFTSTGDAFTDTDGEQSFILALLEINQSGTAAYNGLKIDVTETALGDGSTGDGNNLINLQTASTTKARINNVGSLFLADQAAASADVAAFGQIWVANSTPNELWFTDDAGTDTQISSHPMDAPPELYTNLPGQDFIRVKRHKLLGIIQWQTLDGVITEETFTAYNLRRKDVPGHTDLVKIDYTEWVERQKEALRQQFIKENTVEAEVLKAEAFEMVDVEEKVMYITEIQTQEEYEEDVETIVDGKTVIEKVKKTRPVVKIKKQPNKIGEKVSYKLEGEEVKEVREPIFEMKTVQKPKIKDGVRFDETDGKFYEKVAPTKQMIDDAVNDFEPDLPEWIKTRIINSK